MKTVSYLGTFDDFALRNGIPGTCPKDIDALNSMLIEQAFVGFPVAINDGYLINHPALRAAIAIPESSPLCELAQCSFVTILSRNGGMLERLAEDMANIGTTSAANLLNSPFYQTTLKTRLEEWGSILRSPGYDSFMPWPSRNMEKSFFQTLDIGFSSYLNLASSQWRAKLIDFWSEFASHPNTRRTEWENLAESWERRELFSRRDFLELMRLGNQAYQYSWAGALTLDNANTTTFRVETNASSYFRHLHQDPKINLVRKLKSIVLQAPTINCQFAEKGYFRSVAVACGNASARASGECV